MVKDRKKKKLLLLEKIIIFTIILVALLIILGLLFHNASSNFRTFKENKNYFKNNPDLKVEDWMNPMTILRHFNISEEELFATLTIPNTEANFRTPLSETCRKQAIDCNELIKRVNSLIK